MNNLLISLAAAMLRVAINISVASKKVTDKGKVFSYTTYAKQNWFSSLIGVISGLIFALMAPSIRAVMGYGPEAEILVAFGCGFSSVELLRFVKSLSNSKIPSIVIIVMASSLAFTSCRSDRQKYNAILKRNPAWAVTKTDTVTKEIIVPSIEKQGEANMSIDSLAVINDLKESLRKALYTYHNLSDSSSILNGKVDKLAEAATKSLSKAVKQGKSVCKVDPIFVDNDSLFLSISLDNGNLLYSLYVKPRTIKTEAIIKSTTIPNKIECDESFFGNLRKFGTYFVAGFFCATILAFLLLIRFKK
jgi:hypothetical protein